MASVARPCVGLAAQRKLVNAAKGYALGCHHGFGSTPLRGLGGTKKTGSAAEGHLATRNGDGR